MLQIRPKQMEVLRQFVLESFVKKTTGHLRQTFPENVSTMDENSLKDFILKGIENARKYKINDKDNVVRYIECMMTYGEEFDVAKDTQWAGEILNRDDVRAGEKMDLIDWHDIANPRE